MNLLELRESIGGKVVESISERGCNMQPRFYSR